MDKRQLQVELAVLKHALAGCTCGQTKGHLGLLGTDGVSKVIRKPLSGAARAMAHALRGCEASLEEKVMELSARTSEFSRINTDLATRARDLEAANLEMKNILQQREDFVAALTHDLKNPLIGATRALELMASGKLQQEQQSVMVEQLIDSNKAMLRMIWNLLDIYRHDSGAMVPVYATVSVQELLEKCLGEFAFNIKAKEIDLLLSVADRLPPVVTDEILLRRVLINLLDNAVKFTPDGGRLSVQVSMDGEQVKVSVKDSGPGMSQYHLGRIFERFWQTESGRVKGIGTGLGLFLSRQIVETLGGRIECASVENVGTEFILYLQRDSCG